MTDVPEHDEAAAQANEQARVDELARQNEEVRRAEHPEEFADDAGEEPASAAPVAPATGTGTPAVESGTSGNASSSTTVTESNTTATPPENTTAAPEPNTTPTEPGAIPDEKAQDLVELAGLEEKAKALRQKLFGHGEAL
jgi:hypothetical protein